MYCEARRLIAGHAACGMRATSVVVMCFDYVIHDRNGLVGQILGLGSPQDGMGDEFPSNPFISGYRSWLVVASGNWGKNFVLAIK